MEENSSSYKTDIFQLAVSEEILFNSHRDYELVKKLQGNLSKHDKNH